MTELERNVKQTQFRLGVNTWFAAAGWCLLAGSALWSLTSVADRLFALHLPPLYILGGLLALCSAVSAIWAVTQRRSRIAAAAILDASADLKERTSSGLYCLNASDPFARAVLDDAQEVSRRVSVRSFIRYSWPSSLSFASAAMLLALVVTWLPITPLQAKDQPDKPSTDDQFVQTDVKRVRERLQQLQQQAQTNPALKDLEQSLKTIDDLPVEKLNTPVETRREAIKNIDKLADALRQSRDEKLNQVQELKKMFRGLKATTEPKTPTEQLSKALSKGDFKAAQDAVKELQEQLAKLDQKDDPEGQKKLQEQIEQLSKQLNQLAQQQQNKEQLQKELEQAGVDKEAAKRALENLTKADLEQIKEQMKKKGASEQQIKEMAKKCQGQQQAGQQGSDLAGAMQKAAQAMSAASSAAEAAEQLQAAADQLNSMEQLDQQLGELESMLSDAQDAQNEMSQQQGNYCDKCNGKGCGNCGGTGLKPGCGGMGEKPGQGRGGQAPEEQTAVRFKKERTPVITGPGSIISKMFIDGEQVRGDVTSQVAETFSAAERDATDALNKNQIPNQYRSSVKKYFSEIRSELIGPGQDSPEKAASKAGESSIDSEAAPP